MQNVTTQPNPNLEFNLKNFRIEMSQKTRLGTALASWTQSLPCITRYAIRLSHDVIKGEMHIATPSNMYDNVTLDLHMVPGILNLQNCRQYTLSIYPDNFPEQQLEPGKWTEGLTRTFNYVTKEGDAPNLIDLYEDVTLTTGSDRVEIVWGKESYSCQDVEFTVSTLRYLHGKHSDLEQVRSHS